MEVDSISIFIGVLILVIVLASIGNLIASCALRVCECGDNDDFQANLKSIKMMTKLYHQFYNFANDGEPEVKHQILVGLHEWFQYELNRVTDESQRFDATITDHDKLVTKATLPFQLFESVEAKNIAIFKSKLQSMVEFMCSLLDVKLAVGLTREDIFIPVDQKLRVFEIKIEIRHRSIDYVSLTDVRLPIE